ncbi:MAG: WD40 repeat domain-containing protein [Planctomycetota bacterium]|nr:WD40 repeat domain-containing protein [Planctomycetota bacterium]
MCNRIHAITWNGTRFRFVFPFLLWLLSATGCAGIPALPNESLSPDIISMIEPGEEVTCLRFSPFGNRLAAGTASGGIILIDPETLESRERLEGHMGRVNSVSFSPDENALISAGDDGNMILWPQVGPMQILVHGESPILDASFLAAPDRIGLADLYHGLSTFDTVTESLERISSPGPDEAIRSAVISRSGRYYALAVRRPMRARGSEILIRDLPNKRLIAKISTFHRKVIRVHLAPHERWLVSIYDDGTVQVWEIDTGKPILPGDGWEVDADLAATSFDGHWIAIVTRSGAIFLRELSSQVPGVRLVGTERPVTALAWSPRDNLLLAADVSGGLWAWAIPPRDLTRPQDDSTRGVVELDRLWDQLGERDAALAYSAMMALARGGDETLNGLIRRIAIPDAGEVAGHRKLIEDMRSDDFAIREAAVSRLGELARLPEDALRRALTKPSSGGFVTRARKLLGQMEPPYRRFPSRILQRRRGLLTLELNGTDMAMAFLERVATESTSSTERGDAAAALRRVRVGKRSITRNR